MIDQNVSCRRRLLALVSALLLVVLIPARAEDNTSLRHEIQRSIDRGLTWLTANQNSNGWWQTPDHPAVTSLAVSAFNGDPMNRYRGKETPGLKKAYGYLLDHAQPNGSICVTNLPTYNTAVSMLALLSANDPRYEPILKNARRFLAGTQRDFGKTNELDTPYDGGFGYGLPSDKVSDMSNTILALEAMYYSRHLKTDQPNGGDDLNWKAAIHFLQSCQNLPSHNTNGWASDDPQHKGGFIYHTGRSNAGSKTNSATGRITWRSYASISYAGMLSYIYADLPKDDPRVASVYDWLRKNYTLEENPGMKDAGLYYYYHTMTKALRAYGVDKLVTVDGKEVSWAQDLALKLIQLQQADGSWVNANARWWEKEPALVTSYTLLALELLWRELES
jgi:squalene-hopene/tetraprenyl-beta-curcumene cyclase